LTELLSFRLLEANGKAGNVGRTLALLNLRKSRGYDAHNHEFLYAVASIKAAGTDLLVNRNIYASDAFQPAIDNPTRWLDAILLNMHDRRVPLTIDVANRMLATYSSTGRTGKAVHHFWKMYLTPIQAGGDADDCDDEPTVLIDPLKLSPDDTITTKDTMVYQNRKHRAKLVWRPPPPREKVPSEAKGAVFAMGGAADGTQRRTKLDWEQQHNWSLALTAAFSFADSLTHGACGHGPVELNVDSWNALIKACCYRGALRRAIQVLEETMPSKGIEPDAYSYTLLLDGLAKVGDVSSMRDYFRHVQNKDLVTRSNVRAMVDGMINAGDVAGAVTFLQDMYNQYQVVVKHNVHLKVLEVALASDLVWEAERYVTVMEQIRSHEVNFAWDEPDFCRMLETFQKDPRTSRESIRKVFAYFGETLDERNFLKYIK
jgi:pentatricopeptide repeat protein